MLLLLLIACRPDAQTIPDGGIEDTAAPSSPDTHTTSNTDTGSVPDTDTGSTPDTTTDPDPSPIRLMLHGGGAEADPIYRRFVEAAGFGHIVTLGTQPPNDPGLDVFDAYWVKLGAASATTVNTTRAADADDIARIAAIDAADGLFVRGGDQSRYLDHWQGTAIEAALERAWTRGAVIGGSSAGCAILGGRIYDAQVGSVDPYRALLDPFDEDLTFTDGFLPALPGIITDTHFTERGRLGRLPVFLARWVADGTPDPIGIGVDPGTALFVREDGTAEVMGTGSVTLMRAPDAQTLTPLVPPDIRGIRMWQLTDGYVIDIDAPSPVLARPSWVPLVMSPTTPSLSDGWLRGSDATDRWLGQWVVPDLEAHPYAWYDGELTLQERPDPVLPGVFVMTRLYDDLDFAENHVGATLWALAQHPGALGIVLDVGMDLRLSADRTAQTDRRSYGIFLDTSAMPASGAPNLPGGPHTAALEDVRLDIVGPGEAWP